MADNEMTSSSTSSSTIVSFTSAHHFISVKLIPSNYLFWRTQINLFLEGHDLIGFVDGTHQRPPPSTDPKYSQWVQQDKLIMSLLIASMSEDVFPKDIGLETSHDIWTTLEKVLACPSDNGQSMEQGDQSFTQMDHDLYTSAQVGDLDVLKRNVDQLHVQLTPSKNTLLHVLAQFHDSAECVDVILEMQSSTIKQSMLMWKNSKGETALHIAERNGCSNIVRALIEHAKTLDREEFESGTKLAEQMMRTTNQHGDTALHEAVWNNHTEVAKLLVEEDPDFPHPLNGMKETPLYLAAEIVTMDSIESNCHRMVDLILTTCKSPPYSGPGGRTALHAAVLRNCPDCTRALLKHKPALTKEVDEFGCTPLHYAARFNFVSIARQVLEVDRSAAYITENNDDNRTPLHVAAWQGNVEVMKELLKHCPDCWEMTTSKGRNVLHLAVDNERQVVVDFIVHNSWAGNLINEKDVDGNTPLHLYASSVTLFGRLLMKHPKGNKNAFNRRNLTPLDVIETSETYIFREDSRKSELKRGGGVEGYRNIIQRDQWRYRARKERINERKRKLPNDIINQGGTHLIVAALIATVTFAAGFTLPGGYDGNQGPNQGMAVLARKAAFKAFVVSDTIAVISSIIAVFLYFAASFYEDRRKVVQRYNFASDLIHIAMTAMMVAFMTGLYTVLAPSSELAITVCLLGSFCILIFFSMLYGFICRTLKRLWKTFFPFFFYCT